MLPHFWPCTLWWNVWTESEKWHPAGDFCPATGGWQHTSYPSRLHVLSFPTRGFLEVSISLMQASFIESTGLWGAVCPGVRPTAEQRTPRENSVSFIVCVSGAGNAWHTEILCVCLFNTWINFQGLSPNSVGCKWQKLNSNSLSLQEKVIDRY